MTGIVYLVGAGPGGSGALTAEAQRVLALADVVIHDHLVPASLLSLAGPGAEIVAVGPVHAESGRLAQGEVETLMVERARVGQTVVRFKNGDPMLFGRGGEEAATLAAAGVPFEIVPGVTSAIAVPAYAGIPVTHRDLASAVTIVTGHQAGAEEDPGTAPPLDWNALSRVGGTLVFLMAVRSLERVLSRLVEAGLDPETPAALVERGGTSAQRCVTGTVATLPDAATCEGVRPPAVLVVGRVVDLRATLAWWERRPLFGRRVLVTRAAGQVGGLADRLERLGAEVVSVPTIVLRQRLDAPEVRRAFAEIDRYDWIVFTSVNGVRTFVEGLDASGRDLRALGRARIAAIGSETAKALAAHRITADVVPTEYRAEGLVEALADGIRAGHRVLLPRAAGARSVVPDALRARGVDVDDVALYEATVPDSAEGDRLRALVAAEAGALDVVTFTSSSTVRHFVSLMGPDAPEMLRACGAVVACIGPVTAATARELGLDVGIEATTFTIPALVDAIARHFCTSGGDPLSGGREGS